MATEALKIAVNFLCEKPVSFLRRLVMRTVLAEYPFEDTLSTAKVGREGASLDFSSKRNAQAAWEASFSFMLALARAAGVNSLISVIFAASKRVNKRLRESN